MKTAVKNFSLLCLEKDGEKTYDYKESFKLNYEHYKKVLEAKKSPYPLPKVVVRNFDILEEGDYVYLVLWEKSPIPVFSRPIFGWVEKDKDGYLFIQSFKLTTWTTKPIEQHIFIPERFYFRSKYDNTPNKRLAEFHILFSKTPKEALEKDIEEIAKFNASLAEKIK